MRKWVKQLLIAILVTAASFALGTAVSHVSVFARPCGCGQADANFVGLCLCLIGAASLLYAFSKEATTWGTTPARGRLNMALGGLCGLLAGIMLIALGAAYPGGPLGQNIAIAILIVAVVGTTAAEHLMRRGYSAERRLRNDQLALRTSRVGGPLLLAWAGLAQIGLPVRFTALNLLTALYALSFVIATASGLARMRSQAAD
ncbi:hypothetical protein [Sphingomonas sp. BK580]|uniref:hypothetical protein n=1 Tax=Sphingomonas sp. BK580 TaxID=2586972 RepID=UPI001608A6D0|nr:hypothetical protein [Sphingomonas sp. BK580]MBB3692487.1 hypothetical protein [Sphingomonas sp. BK580]